MAGGLLELRQAVLLEQGRVIGREQGQEGQVPKRRLPEAFPGSAAKHGLRDEGLLLAVGEEPGDDVRLLPHGRGRRGKALLLACDVVVVAWGGGRGAAQGDRGEE